MKILSDLLGKYKKIVSTDRKTAEVVIEAVSRYAGITLRRDQLKIGNQAVFVKAPSAIKAEIFLKRQKILDEVQRILGPESPKMIV